MRKIPIVLNWKMQLLSWGQVKDLFDSIIEGIRTVSFQDKAELIICASFIDLGLLGRQDLIGGVVLGAQDSWTKEKGAFTGETSARRLKEVCKYVILGHSERNETDELVNEKVKTALGAGLIPVLCFKRVEQLDARLKGVSDQDREKILISYEPPGAISTDGGKIPEDQALKQDLSRIRDSFQGLKAMILYGGSVDSSNFRKFIDLGYDGVLVGGAALKPGQVIDIIKTASEF